MPKSNTVRKQTIKNKVDQTIIAAGRLLNPIQERETQKMEADKAARAQAVLPPTQQQTPTQQPKPKVDPSLTQPHNTFAIPNVGNVDKATYEAYKATQGFDSGTKQPITEEQKETIAQDVGSNIGQQTQMQEVVQQLKNNQTSNEQPTSTLKLGQGAEDIAANVLTNIPSIAAGASAGAGLGATIGSVVPVAGTAVGAVVGGLIGGITAFFGKLALDKRQATREAMKAFRVTSSKRYKELMNMANARSESPADIMRGYEANLAIIREAERELKAQTRGAVGKQLSGAMDELIEVQLYLESEPYYRNQLWGAIMRPDKSQIDLSIYQDLNTQENNN